MGWLASNIFSLVSTGTVAVVARHWGAGELESLPVGWRAETERWGKDPVSVVRPLYGADLAVFRVPTTGTLHATLR